MSEDPRWLDGNALGGLLQELFGAEMTGAPHTCQACGTERPVAAHRLYLGRRNGPSLPGLRPDRSRRGCATRPRCGAPQRGVAVGDAARLA